MFFSRRTAPIVDGERVNHLLTRGVEAVIPRELAVKKLASGERLRVYLGIDPTGAALHLGHSVVLRKLNEFAELGHDVIFVVGSFTAMIGDPSGRDIMREPLAKEDVEKNFRDYKQQASKVLDFSRVSVRYNHEWLEKLSLADLTKLASNFTVQQLLQRDMFQKRLEEGKPIALHEFLYPVMVGYDSAFLDVDCEIGGSDQEFNILAGRQLQTALKKRDKFVLTTKLIEGTDGRKMSKSYNNCVFLEDTAPVMFGKLMSIRDELVPVYLDVLTDLSAEEQKTILAMHPKDAKAALAKEIVRMYHGERDATRALDTFDATFRKGEVPDDVQEVKSLGTLKDTLVKNGVVESNSEYTRLVLSNAVRRIDGGSDTKITDAHTAHAPHGAVFRIGKHRIVKIIE